jgi:hypothetical protein
MRHAIVLASLFLGCATAPSAVCDEIGERCHNAGSMDGGSAEQKTCHDLAHQGWTEAECTRERSRCLALCP